jgi:hypothetical protein
MEIEGVRRARKRTYAYGDGVATDVGAAELRIYNARGHTHISDICNYTLSLRMRDIGFQALVCHCVYVVYVCVCACVHRDNNTAYTRARGKCQCVRVCFLCTIRMRTCVCVCVCVCVCENLLPDENRYRGIRPSASENLSHNSDSVGAFSLR